MFNINLPPVYTLNKVAHKLNFLTLTAYKIASGYANLPELHKKFERQLFWTRFALFMAQNFK